MIADHRSESAHAGRPCGASALALVAALTASLWFAPRASAADPAFALALRAGTPGVGLDLDLGLSKSLGVRLGYAGFNINHSISTSDVDYNGNLKLRMFTALLDWYVFRGGFHLTVGAANNATRLDVTGLPAQGSYTINGRTYSLSELGSLTGRAKFPHAVAPYVGIGWGNPVGQGGRVHFLFDVGAVYGGAPVVGLVAHCGPAAPSGGSVCAQIQSDAALEQSKLQEKVHSDKWYPVVNLGLSVRF